LSFVLVGDIEVVVMVEVTVMANIVTKMFRRHELNAIISDGLTAMREEDSTKHARSPSAPHSTYEHTASRRKRDDKDENERNIPRPVLVHSHEGHWQASSPPSYHYDLILPCLARSISTQYSGESAAPVVSQKPEPNAVVQG